MKGEEREELDREHSKEAHRIRDVYTHLPRRAALDLFGRCAVHEREERLVRMLQRKGLRSLEGLKILDVGCGAGALLRRLFDLGAEPKNCYGVDLMENLLYIGKQLSPTSVSFVEANATRLPFGDEEFDLALQFTMFSSVLDRALKRTIMREILRTLSGGGYFIWYDFAFSSPGNDTVRGIGKREIQELLKDCQLEFERVTLAPPLGRIAARMSPTLYHLLSSLYWLRTHYICCAKKSERPSVPAGGACAVCR
jgi:ubiquinone/menaquinone biosynthesis C-methylase UbiE